MGAMGAMVVAHVLYVVTATYHGLHTFCVKIDRQTNPTMLIGYNYNYISALL